MLPATAKKRHQHLKFEKLTRSYSQSPWFDYIKIITSGCCFVQFFFFDLSVVLLETNQKTAQIISNHKFLWYV
jgi:hypothetical protein